MLNDHPSLLNTTPKKYKNKNHVYLSGYLIIKKLLIPVKQMFHNKTKNKEDNIKKKMSIVDTCQLLPTSSSYVLPSPIVFSTPDLTSPEVSVAPWPITGTPALLFASRTGSRAVIRAVVAPTPCCKHDNQTFPSLDTHDAHNNIFHEELHIKHTDHMHPDTHMRKIAVAVKFIQNKTIPCRLEPAAVRREILCNVRLQTRVQRLRKKCQNTKILDRQRRVLGPKDIQTWQPSAKLVGYHLNKQYPQQSILVTSLIWGPDLSQWLEFERSNYSFTRQSTFLRLWLSILALRRVFQLHEIGIRHNDIKPSNLMIDFLGTFTNNVSNKSQLSSAKQRINVTPCIFSQCLTDTIIKLSDIDIKLIDLGSATPTYLSRHSGGTPAYLSPEQLIMGYHQRHKHYKKQKLIEQSFLPLDQRTDLWSLGLTLVELLTIYPLSNALNNERPLKYIGTYEDEWSESPQHYINRLKVKFFSKEEYDNNSTGYEAAKRIFDCFIKEHPDDRGHIEDAIYILLEQALIFKGINPEHVLQPYHSFSHKKSLNIFTSQTPVPTIIPSWIDAFFLGTR